MENIRESVTKCPLCHKDSVKRELFKKDGVFFSTGFLQNKASELDELRGGGFSLFALV